MGNVEFLKAIDGGVVLVENRGGVLSPLVIDGRWVSFADEATARRWLAVAA